MKSQILAALVGAPFVFVSVAAQAMPAAAVDGAGQAPQITRVAQGCGPGFARGPAGGCRPIARERVVVVPRRPVVVVPARPVGCGVRVGPVAVRTGC